MSKRRDSQVGFRDDTSYLAAHYGGGRTPRPIAQTATAKGASSSTARDARVDLPNNQPHSSSVSSTPLLAVAQANPTAKSSTPAPPRCSRSNTPPTGSRNRHSSSRSSSGGVGGVGRGVADNAAATVERGSGASIRPTLSEQLASIGKAAGDITAGIRETYGLKPLEGALLTTPSKSFLVGKLRCKYPSPVHFFSHKCVYTFHHPFEATRITMEMFFRDMRCAELDSPKRHLRFKINHPLCHYRRDYAHDDPAHFVVIEFSSGLDVERVAQEIMPIIRRSGLGSSR